MGDDTVLTALRAYRYRFADEAGLQAAVALALAAAGVAFEREAPLGQGRIDFLVGGVGVECKVDGSLSALTRQIHRYLQHDTLSSLVVVTSRATHRRLPPTVNGKSVSVFWLGL